MPRTTKDVKKDKLEKEKIDTTSTTTAKKSVTKSTKKSDKSNTNTKVSSKSSTSEKKTTTKSTSKATKSSSTKKVVKNSNTNKKSTAKKKITSKAKKIENSVVAEYYDLPYRYNETIVKILYQTPSILFVYWDISDEDKAAFISQYGNNFFETTFPILKVYNLTMNYQFEVPINDFANSWYIHVNDAGCDYKVELLRKPIEMHTDNSYIFISSSNDIEFPNDHILIDELPDKVLFKNIKSNEIITKDIGTLRLVGINKIYSSVADFYKRLYKDEDFQEINNNKIIDLPSSSWK